jgi:D-glycero-alpha-D-manno-heptose-7-phosphate kinase
VTLSVFAGFAGGNTKVWFMIISSTPLRISLLGGGSDLAAYYRRRGGMVVSSTIDKYIYVTISRKFDDSVRVSYSRTEEVATASDVEHPVVREALGFLGIHGGVEITSIADIPARGTGLGSSSAFTVGLLNALHAYSGRHVAAAQLAEESCHIEIDRCGEPIGRQDQYAAAFGGMNCIRFMPDDTVTVQRCLWKPEVFEDLQSRLMMFYTGITRSASSLLSEQTTHLASDEARVKMMDRMVATAEMIMGDLQSGRLDTLGEALHESWELKKAMAKGISTPWIDEVYEVARDAGAIGGKILGAGGGGFLLFVVPPGCQAAVRARLCGLRETPFRFSRHGSQIIFVH